VSIDVGSLPDSLFESELFGYKKGAFTDAKEDRIGKIQAADKGTLFLDEISNLTFTNQAKLLTTVQQKSINPLGSNLKLAVDFRLICATNKDLKQLLINNLFREDLLYRINTIQIDLPPLRERKSDVPLLADHFLSFFKRKYEKANLKISNDAVDQLMRYYWPGNIRELKHTIEKAVILSETDILRASNFSLNNPIINTFSKNTPKKLDEIEKEAILEALSNNNGNIKESAKELGIARQTFYNKMQKYNL
jgi:transcriptional regulator with PAS, ATPase and Fis domain